MLKGTKHSEKTKKKMRKNHVGNTGNKCSEYTRIKLILCKTGDKNPMWKGNKVSYSTLHQWVRRHILHLDICQNCKIKKSHDLANKSGKYKRKLNDWEWLCRSCHMKKDGRIFNLKQYSLGKNNES